jgi:hypothetical protein
MHGARFSTGIRTIEDVIEGHAFAPLEALLHACVRWHSSACVQWHSSACVQWHSSACVQWHSSACLLSYWLAL